MKKKGNFWMTLGGMLFLAAFLLSIYNIQDAKRAERESAALLDQINEEIQQVNTEGENVPAYVLYPEMEMPIMEIDGELYIGYLEIPELALTLPVAGGEWNDAKMKKSPCLYEGTAYMKNMIIVGHNYRSHFSGLKRLENGTEIKFTDADGNRFTYVLAWTEVIDEMDVQAMVSQEEEWDLTLFTCTYGGRERYTLRCVEEY